MVLQSTKPTSIFNLFYPRTEVQYYIPLLFYLQNSVQNYLSIHINLTHTMYYRFLNILSKLCQTSVGSDNGESLFSLSMRLWENRWFDWAIVVEITLLHMRRVDCPIAMRNNWFQSPGNYWLDFMCMWCRMYSARNSWVFWDIIRHMSCIWWMTPRRIESIKRWKLRKRRCRLQRKESMIVGKVKSVYSAGSMIFMIIPLWKDCVWVRWMFTDRPQLWSGRRNIFCRPHHGFRPLLVRTMLNHAQWL